MISITSTVRTCSPFELDWDPGEAWIWPAAGRLDAVEGELGLRGAGDEPTERASIVRIFDPNESDTFCCRVPPEPTIVP